MQCHCGGDPDASCRGAIAQPEVQARVSARASWTYSSLAAAAAPFGVSTEAFLRRPADLGRVDPGFYSARREEDLARYEDEEAKSQGGGDWYRNTARDLGKATSGSCLTLTGDGSSTPAPQRPTSMSR